MDVKDFSSMFNLPSNVDPEIQEAISYLRNSVLSFVHHFEQISVDEIYSIELTHKDRICIDTMECRTAGNDS